MKRLGVKQRVTAACFVLATASVPTTGCDPATMPSQPPVAIESDDFTASRARWESWDTGDYSFNFQSFCFCSPVVTQPYLVEVQDNVVVSAQILNTLEYLPRIGKTSPAFRSRSDKQELFQVRRQWEWAPFLGRLRALPEEPRADGVRLRSGSGAEAVGIARIARRGDRPGLISRARSNPLTPPRAPE